MVWTGFIWLRIGPVEGSCEYGNEPSGSMKCWEIFEWLHNWHLLKKDSVPWRSVLPSPPSFLNFYMRLLLVGLRSGIKRMGKG
jgi:hypothetical protein